MEVLGAAGRAIFTARAMDKPQLYGTPLSHFTRKIRILCAEIGVAVDFVRIPGVLAASPTTFGDNPLMRVPTLVYGADVVIESDHIARYLVDRYDPGDRLGVRSDRVDYLNHLAVAGGVMDNEVTLVLARRGGLEDLDSVTYFRKLKMAIETGLAWLDRRTVPDEETFDYRDVVTICMWQHLLHYALVPRPGDYARIAARVARFAVRPSVAGTTPEASLAEAAAAGWKPG
jgi:glutathione S-transferase